MFKRFVAILGGIVLPCQLFAVPSNAIFMSRLKATGVKSSNSTTETVFSFTTRSSGGWDYLIAHTQSGSDTIIKDSLSGIKLKGFDPDGEAPIDSFTAGSGGSWAYLIAYGGDQSDTIIKTEWKGTWVQGYSGSGVVNGFTADRSAGSGDSVWLMVTIGEIGIEESDERGEILVSGFKGIAPNPCFGYTRISYTVGSSRYQVTGDRCQVAGASTNTCNLTPITLRLYDLSGRLVSTLINKSQKPGRYSLLWHERDDRGRKVATGVYFLRLKAGKFVRVRKLVVIRW